MPAAARCESRVIRNGAIDRGKDRRPTCVQLAVSEVQHPVAADRHGGVPVEVVLPRTRGAARPRRIVLRPVDLDVGVLGHPEVEATDTRDDHLLRARPTRFGVANAEDRLTVSLVERAHQASPASDPSRGIRKDAIERGRGQKTALQRGAAAGDGDLPGFAREHRQEGVVQRNPPRTAASAMVDPVHRCIRSSEAPTAVGGAAEPIGVRRHRDVKRCVSRNREAERLERRERGQPPADPDGTHRRLRESGHRVPAVPHPEDPAPAESEAQLPVREPDRKQVAAAEEPSPAPDDAFHRLHAPTMPRGDVTRAAATRTCGVRASVHPAADSSRRKRRRNRATWAIA